MNYLVYIKSTGEIVGHGSGLINDILSLDTEDQGVVITNESVDPTQKKIESGEIVDIDVGLLSELNQRQKNKNQIELRTQRNSLLFASDWTQLADVSVANKELWDNYRQALRDLPEQYSEITSLDEVIWPQPPE